MFEPDHDAFATAERVPAWTRPAERRFNAAPGGQFGGFSAWASPEARQAEAYAEPEMPVAPVIEPEALIAQGYADGIAEGRRLAEAELAEERLALVQLAQSLEGLQPEPPQALAAMLATTVRRLVTQIMGEVEIDAQTLEERVATIAALIAEESSPSRLRLNPADMALLAGASMGLEIVPDPSLTRGTILMETGSGWVEDGPQVRLEKLRAALDRMGAPR